MIRTLASSAMKQQIKEIKKCLGVGREREREREGEREREKRGAVYPGGGGVLKKVLYGEPLLEVQPLYTIFERKGTSFVYFLLTNVNPSRF